MLDRYIFKSLLEVKEITKLWIKEYNEERPHQALNSLTPKQYLKLKQPDFSSLEWH